MNKNLIFIILTFFVCHSLQAQKKPKEVKKKPERMEEAGHNILGLHAGLSLTGLLYEALSSDTIGKVYNTSVKPAIQFTWDHFINNKISVGLFGSVQPFRVDISSWKFDTLQPKEIVDLQAKMRRVYIGGKALYHFKNTSKVDIYSGIRAGVLFWNNKLPSTDPAFVSDFNDDFPRLNRPSIGLIPIGFRIKLHPQFAANIEINASAPHLLSFGACYTLK